MYEISNICKFEFIYVYMDVSKEMKIMIIVLVDSEYIVYLFLC